MPAIDNNSVDESPAFEQTVGFQGGQVSATKPGFVAEPGYSQGINFDTDEMGNLVCRRGHIVTLGDVISTVWDEETRQWENITDLWSAQLTAPITGMAFWRAIDSSNVEKEYIAVADSAGSDNIKLASSSGVYTAVTGTTTSGTVYFAALNNRLYYADGTNSLRYIDRDAANQSVASGPPKPVYLTTHTNRLFCASASTTVEPDTLYVSHVLDGTTWPGADTIRIGGDYDPIVALYSWYDFNLLVFKRQSIYVVNADPSASPSQWEIRVISDNIGCISDQSVQGIGGDVFFLARDGVRSVRSVLNASRTDVSITVSAPINDLIQRINQSALDTVRSVYYRNRYMLAVPLDSDTYPTKTLVFNTVTSRWLGYWEGVDVRAFAITAFDGQVRLQVGDQQGFISTFADYLDDDDTTAYKDLTDQITSQLVTRGMEFGDRYADKQGYQVEFEMSNGTSEAGTMTLTALYNNSATSTTLGSSVTLTGSSKLFRKGYNLLSHGRWQVAQFKLVSTGGRPVVHAVKASAFVDAVQPER